MCGEREGRLARQRVLGLSSLVAESAKSDGDHSEQGDTFDFLSLFCEDGYETWSTIFCTLRASLFLMIVYLERARVGHKIDLGSHLANAGVPGLCAPRTSKTTACPSLPPSLVVRGPRPDRVMHVGGRLWTLGLLILQVGTAQCQSDGNSKGDEFAIRVIVIGLVVWLLVVGGLGWSACIRKKIKDCKEKAVELDHAIDSAMEGAARDVQEALEEARKEGGEMAKRVSDATDSMAAQISSSADGVASQITSATSSKDIVKNTGAQPSGSK